MNVDELIQKTQKGKMSKEYYLEVEQEIKEFFAGDHPQKEKDKLKRYGYLESLYMICQGIRYTDNNNMYNESDLK